ncbi:putative protein phosphatase 2C 76 isoform X2 [Beta vulgaris subsp. vulgaris]|uniref:putative protein phosphatase 2C 76 isoform X2 n=1 Tax=Beta vulgaris subsp. vulgaris TaxID=3555 RepID=UPI00254712AB|nr:putative protein phosphatase 2C 76 isoform X2 [Beta vulgaris subsp. vulgaris]
MPSVEALLSRTFAGKLQVSCRRASRSPEIGGGPSGFTEVAVGIVAVFDGHNGSEASDMASKLLLEYLILHMYFLLDATFPSFLKKSMGGLSTKGVLTFSFQFFKDREWILSFIDQESFGLNVKSKS